MVVTSAASHRLVKVNLEMIFPNLKWKFHHEEKNRNQIFLLPSPLEEKDIL